MGLAGGKLPIIAVAGLLAFFVASCGGGDDDSTTVVQSQDGGTGKSAQGEKDGSSKSKQSGGSRDDSGGSTAAKHEDSGGGSAQFKTGGSDNSILEFGKEGSESEFRQAREAVHRFFDARAEEDWEAVCANLSGSAIEGIKSLIRKSKKASGAGCAKTMEAAFAEAPKSVIEGEAEADIGALRVEGDRAFVIYRNAEDEVFAMSMERVDGAWKAAALAGIALS